MSLAHFPIWFNKCFFYLRANIYKSELREAEGMKVKLENKDLDIKELKLMLRSKGKLVIFT